MSEYLPIYGTQVSGPVCLSVGRRIKGRWLWPLKLSWRVYVYRYDTATGIREVLYNTWSKKKALRKYNALRREEED